MAVRAAQGWCSDCQSGEQAARCGVGRRRQWLSDQYGKIQSSAFDAQGKIANYDRIGQLLQGVSTGALTPALTTVAAYGRSSRHDPLIRILGAKQAVEALSNQIALQLRNPSGGAGMPGALSDKDREFLVSMTPNLAKTPEGNAMIIDTAKRMAQRDMEVGQMARDYRQRHGHMDEGFFDELRQYSATHPLFSQAAPRVQALPGGWSVKRVQ